MRIAKAVAVAGVLAIAVGAGAPAAQAMRPARLNFGSKMLTAPEATRLVKASPALTDGFSQDSRKSWMRMFDGGDGTMYMSLVSLYEKPKKVSGGNLPVGPGSGQPSGPKLDCKVYENKPPRYTSVCWSKTLMFGVSTITVGTKYIVTGQVTYQPGAGSPTGSVPQPTLPPEPTLPEPTPTDSVDPGLDGTGSAWTTRALPAWTQAEKDKAAAEAKSLRDGQLEKIQKG